MKCFKHPHEDAVGVCIKCGKNVCLSCANTLEEKIFCEKCVESYRYIEQSTLKQFILISAVLGWLGSIDTGFIGAYTAPYLLKLAVILEGNFQIIAYVICVFAGILALTLVFGGYLMWKGSLRKGGILNLMAGMGTVLIYIYFIFNIPLTFEMKHFGITGFLLCIPAVLSGIFGLILTRFRR